MRRERERKFPPGFPKSAYSHHVSKRWQPVHTEWKRMTILEEEGFTKSWKKWDCGSTGSQIQKAQTTSSGILHILMANKGPLSTLGVRHTPTPPYQTPGKISNLLQERPLALQFPHSQAINQADTHSREQLPGYLYYGSKLLRWQCLSPDTAMLIYLASSCFL